MSTAELTPDYDAMPFRRAGSSGIRLPLISLGLWHNFGDVDAYETAREMVLRAFEMGVTHFDLANNYGPPPGSAERTFGRILASDLSGRRDELVISSKAGYRMWDGPYGDGGSRKYLLTSLQQSLRRLGTDYVDIFYHHRPDADTPLEESMRALDHAVRSGMALYAGISNYPADRAREAISMLQSMGTPYLLHQPKYNMFERTIEDGLLDVLDDAGMGCVVYSPLAQGLLTDRYLDGIPEDSRAAKSHGFLERDEVTDDRLQRVRELREIARERGQSMAQMAVSWVLRDARVTSAIVGTSSVEQLQENVAAARKADFDPSELRRIESTLS